MASRNVSSRSIVFEPCSTIADFLESGYASLGVGQTSLSNLLPIYSSPSLIALSSLRRLSSDRNRRAGDKGPGKDESAFSVIMFKKFTPNLPPGLTVDAFAKFFTALFKFSTLEEEQESNTSTKALLNNKHYIVMAITAPIFLSESPKQLTHFIIAAALYIYDPKSGSYLSLLGVTETGYPSICTLSKEYFIDTTDSDILLNNNSFRGRGLGTFLLSAIQVIGYMKYHAPRNMSTSSTSISCSESEDDSNPRHHLYLQARLEMGSAYVMYVQMGFTTLAIENGSYRCSFHREQCPVLASKMSKDNGASGFIIDDNTLRLLVLKKWLYNVYPPESSTTSMVQNEILSSGLLPPPNNPITHLYTNSAYLQLLHCRNKLDYKPLQFYEGFGDTSLLSLPIDRTVSTKNRVSVPSRQHMISGLKMEPSDIRRLMFRSLVAFVGEESKLDAFEVIAAALYTEGKLETSDEDQFSHPEMSLELRLNLIAFYRRLQRLIITSPILESWSVLAMEEYHDAVSKNLESSLGLSDFNGDLVSFTNERLQWKDNFGVLADRLSITPPAISSNPPLWMDIYALQLLYLQQDRPVLLAPVYGHAIRQDGGMYFAGLQVPDIPALTLFAGPNEGTPYVLPDYFTVVPLLAKTSTTFGYLSRTPQKTVSDIGLCKSILNFRQKNHPNLNRFRGLPRLSVLEGRTDRYKPSYRPGDCASKALCLEKELARSTTRKSSSHECPGCKLPVHPGCGYLNPNMLSDVFNVTCLLCFDLYGQVLGSNVDVEDDTSTEEESNTMISTPRTDTDRTDRRTDQNNPSYMYPKENEADVVWWLDENEDFCDCTPASGHRAIDPVDSHIFSTDELSVFSKTNWDVQSAKTKQPKSFTEIIRASYALEKFLKQSADCSESPLPPGLHRPNKEYSSQDLVNICCLVDRAREFAIDTDYHGKVKTKFSLRVDSYEITEGQTLKSYACVRKKARPEPPGVEQFMEVYRSWLKKYLDYFNPALYTYLLTYADGMTVKRFQNQLAADNEIDYQFSGFYDVDTHIVPLPKMHGAVSTSMNPLVPKKPKPSKVDVVEKKKRREEEKEMKASCNPPGFEYVPVARSESTQIPTSQLQIRGLKAQLLKQKRGKPIVRWLGLQGEKYVSLPTDWVELNFDKELILDKAKRMAEDWLEKRSVKNRFFHLPVGDSRHDDPPIDIRDERGFNFYYQGEDDNCVLGGLVNAVYWMFSPYEADSLLRVRKVKKNTDSDDNVWFKLVQKANSVFSEGYSMQKLNIEEKDTLLIPDSYPVVVQLQSKDGSQSHAVCLYKGRIYDSASRYVLIKNEAALNWCCGAYPFARHLKLYHLVPKERKDKTLQQGKKKKLCLSHVG